MNRKCRILHLSRSLDIGGQERLLVEFARWTDRTRFDLHFLSLTGRGILADLLVEQGWKVTALDAAEGLRPGLIFRLARFFRAGAFDVVHTHDDKPLLYASPAAILARVGRLIHTHHHGPLPHIGPRQLALIRLAARAADGFVCVSDHSARYMARQGVPRPMTIRNGIDLARFPFQGPRAQGPVVCVARLSPEKDIASLLHAAAILKARWHDFRLEIAGDGPERDTLLRLTAEQNLNEHVRFLGEVHDVPALLSRARMFVLPSRTEGISLTILEAMARGLPVVATRVGGNPEVVVEGETGLLPPPRDPQRLADAIASLWSDAERCNLWGRRGRERVEQAFDVRRMVERYEELYLAK